MLIVVPLYVHFRLEVSFGEVDGGEITRTVVVAGELCVQQSHPLVSLSNEARAEQVVQVGLVHSKPSRASSKHELHSRVGVRLVLHFLHELEQGVEQLWSPRYYQPPYRHLVVVRLETNRKWVQLNPEFRLS